MERIEAITFYGILTTSFYFSKVIGALFGDLLIGNKIAILIGGLLQTIGCFLICYNTMTFLYLGVGFMVIGNGLFSPNLLAQFGKQYKNKPKIIDAGFNGLFFFINVGAFFGVMTLSLIGRENYNYGFIIGGILVLMATFLAYFNKDEKLDSIEKTIESSITLKLIYVFIAVIIAGVFWACYEISSGLTTTYVQQTSLEFSTYFNLISVFGLLFSLLLAVIWTFVYTNQFSKFCVGLIISALAMSLLISYPENPEEGSSIILILFTLLLSLGEAFLSPLLYSVTTKYSNPKYLAIFLSLVALPILMFNKIAAKIGELTFDFDSSGIFIAITSALVFFGIIAFIMWFIQKQDDDKLVSQNKIIEEF